MARVYSWHLAWLEKVCIRSKWSLTWRFKWLGTSRGIQKLCSSQASTQVDSHLLMALLRVCSHAGHPLYHATQRPGDYSAASAHYLPPLPSQTLLPWPRGGRREGVQVSSLAPWLPPLL